MLVRGGGELWGVNAVVVECVPATASPFIAPDHIIPNDKSTFSVTCRYKVGEKTTDLNFISAASYEVGEKIPIEVRERRPWENSLGAQVVNPQKPALWRTVFVYAIWAVVLFSLLRTFVAMLR